jgi:hypothetical protein
MDRPAKPALSVLLVKIANNAANTQIILPILTFEKSLIYGPNSLQMFSYLALTNSSLRASQRLDAILQ